MGAQLIPALDAEPRVAGRPGPDRDRRRAGAGPPGPPRDGDGDLPARPEPGSPLSNARLGTLMLLAAETMFFGGLVGAFMVLRLSAGVWPPPSQPRLPVGVTALNTVVLLVSSYTMLRAVRAIRQDDGRGLGAWLGRTAGLGGAFLLVQGVEWLRLIRFGLSVSSGVYGATFYTLIGAHGVHVLGALGWVGAVWVAAGRGRYRGEDHEGVVACSLYWHFVVALWPLLYLLVYLL